MKHALFPLDELAPGTMRAVRVGSTEIAIVRTGDGEVHALRNSCPHHGARLSFGTVTPYDVSDTVGDRRGTDQWVVRCPWHGFEFRVDDGRCPADPDRVRVRTYPVSIENGVVVLER